MIVIDIIAILMIAGGLLLFFGGAVGLVRFPDFYSRMHAAGKGDTLSTMLLVGGFCVYQIHEVVDAFGHEGWWKPILVIVKLMGISLFIMLTSPTSSHALMEAGYRDGIEPKVARDDLKDKGPTS